MFSGRVSTIGTGNFRAVSPVFRPCYASGA
jgi:hypothetical protein